jgi:hypothetical protein
MKGLADVELSEYFSFSQLYKGLVNQGQGIAIFASKSIKYTEIDIKV